MLRFKKFTLYIFLGDAEQVKGRGQGQVRRGRSLGQVWRGQGLG